MAVSNLTLGCGLAFDAINGQLPYKAIIVARRGIRYFSQINLRLGSAMSADKRGAGVGRSVMSRTIRLLLLILEAFGAAVFLWPSATFGFSRVIQEWVPDEGRDIDPLFDRSGCVNLERDYE